MNLVARRDVADLIAEPDLDVVALGSCLVEMTPVHTGADLASSDSYIALPSGAASNFAIALARLGVKTGFVTRVGADELGQWLLSRLGDFGVVTEGLAASVDGQLTPVSFCWMDQAGDKKFYFYRFAGHCDPMATVTAEQLGADTVGRGSIYDFSEATIRAQPLREAALEGAGVARNAGRTVVYAVNYRPGSWGETVEQTVEVQREAIAASDVVLMNYEEARLLTGVATIDEAVEIIAGLGPRTIAITAGEHGATVHSSGETVRIPSRRVPVVYDVGAGDTFHAGFVAAYLAGMGPEQMGRVAADAAALRISREASLKCLPTWDEVLALGEQPV